jgi:hypothetical protein
MATIAVATSRALGVVAYLGLTAMFALGLASTGEPIDVEAAPSSEVPTGTVGTDALPPVEVTPKEGPSEPGPVERDNKPVVGPTLTPSASSPAPLQLVLLDRAPAPGTTGVSVEADVVATFSRPLGEITDVSFALRDGWTGETVPAELALDGGRRVATLKPSSGLLPGHPYDVDVSAPAEDYGAVMVPPGSWTFITAPEVLSQRYHFSAMLDYESGLLDVVQTLEWTNTGATPARSINLSVIPAHVGAFTLTDVVTVNGVTADAGFAGYGTNFVITLPRPVPPTATTEISIPFNLVVGPNEGAFGGRLASRNGVMQFGQWFPIWSTAHGFHEVGDTQVSWNADRMTLDLTSRTELGIDAVAASGALQPGATADHWVFEAENVRDFAFSVYPGYRLRHGEASCDGRRTVVTAYAKDGSPELLLESGLRAMETYNSWYGCYAYDTLSIAEAGSPDFSMEFPSVVFIGAKHVDRPSIVYHEVAHQWWYAMVGNDQLEEPWLDEAFAEHSARLVDGESTEYCGQGRLGSTVYEFTEWSDCAYVDAIYLEGSAFLESIHERMGDAAFFAAMQSIVTTYRHDMATTGGVLEILRGETDATLDDLFVGHGLE